MKAKNDLHLLRLSVNGEQHELRVEARATLLDVLRESLGLSGTKKGCNQGACGACTVLANGQRINSCLALAVQYDGLDITTIEGVAVDGQLHPMQRAFIEHDGLQCGYCTPGQICSALAMIEELRQGLPSAMTATAQKADLLCSDGEIKERMSGNLCRCGAYVGITAAIRQVLHEVQS